ncbi:unnamed protein product, partial [Owenia fusiformis]
IKMADRSRQAVAQGGFWSSQQPQYSQQTQELMKQMMKESKLTAFQQRQLSQTMQKGETLPPRVLPTTSAEPGMLETVGPPPPPKVLNPKNYKGNMRKKEDIEASGAYKRQKFRPQPGPNRSADKDKERLQNMMAYGEDLPAPTSASIRKARAKMLPEDEPYVDRFDELQGEINERKQFMKDMEKLGQGDKFRQIIDTEVSQKIREMEIIDRKRTEQLEDYIKKRNNEKQKEKTIPHVSFENSDK